MSAAPASPATSGSRRALLDRARSQLAAGDAATALHTALAVTEDDDLGGEAHALAAEAAEAAGRPDEAARLWERVLADDVDHALAGARLAALRPAPAPGTRAPEAPLPAAPTFVSPEGIQALRYKLLREIGRGASATVYLARDDALGIDVALKILHPHLAASARSGSRRRFFEEARMACRLRHPGVVAIHDLDEATRSIVMEHVPGGTLRTRLAHGHPELDETVATARSLFAALAYVHGEGVVHGDIKPSNLLLRAAGRVVLADFGIAHLGREHDAGAALPTGAGTPLYLAPEQFGGSGSTPATDLFAAGAVLWEMLAGRPMRRAADVLTTTLAPAPLPDLPAQAEALRELVERLLTPDPRDRLASADLALKFL